MKKSKQLVIRLVISAIIILSIVVFTALPIFDDSIKNVEGAEQCYWLPDSGYVRTNGNRTCEEDEYIAGFGGRDAGEHYGTYDWKIKCCNIEGFQGSNNSEWTTEWIYRGNETGNLNEYMTGFRGRDGGDAFQWNAKFNQLVNTQKTSCYWTDLSWGQVRECANDEFVGGFKGIGMYEGHHRGTYGWKLQCCKYETQVIECSQNSDCGVNSWTGSTSCSNNDVFQLFMSFTCNNAGQVNSFCSDITNLILKQDCGEDYCNGFGNNYCKNGDVYHSRDCYDKGCSLGACFDNLNIDEQKVQECEFGCSNGECLSEESECENGETQSCNTGQLGMCAEGTQTCVEGSWGSCIRDNEPETEICDELDNDCDGLIDEGGVCEVVECTTNSDCDDGLFCNGQETCVDEYCLNGNQVDCSSNNLAEIDTCNNNPDNNPFTWDFRNAFTSTCNEDSNSCAAGIISINHTLEIGKCEVECLDDSDCDNDEVCDDYQCEEKNNNDEHETDSGKISSHITDLDNSIIASILSPNQSIVLGTSEDTTAEKENGKNNLWLWILIILIIVLFIIMIIVLVSR